VHVREAYDRHSYASIRKDDGVCQHHHGSCEHSPRFATVHEPFMNRERWWCRTVLNWGIDSVSHAGAASAHVCNSLITLKFRPHKFASFQEVLPFPYLMT
jgi:hypothetical protein